jgi:hypothetical protein
MNIKAIVVYLDDNERNLEEFTWLYKTWILNDLNIEYDLVIYGPIEVQEKLPIHNNIIFRKMDPVYLKDSFWINYRFVNSFAMFNESSERLWISKYKYILKTDCDVFLTKNLLGLEPEKTFIGYGGYMSSKEGSEVSSKLIEFSKKLNFVYQNINHIGASIFGKTDLLTTLIYSHFLVTKFILKSFGNDLGKWPGWFRGVSSMYAIHLVINNFCEVKKIKQNTLDEFCADDKITKDTYHIHAWHYDGYFSKHKWFNGEYGKLVVDIIPSVANQYCHWIVSNSLEEILKVRDSNLS